MRKLPLLISLLLLGTNIIINVASSQQVQTGDSEKLKEAANLAANVKELYKQRKYDEAIPIAKRVLRLREASLPANDELIVSAITNLAELFEATDDYNSARGAYERLVRVQEETFGKEDEKLLSALTKLAYLHYRVGDFRKAENGYRRILLINEKKFGASSWQVSHALYQLAEFYRHRANFKQANPLYDRALTIGLEIYGQEDARLRRIIERYQCLLHEHDKGEMLENLRERLIKAYRGETCPSSSVLNGRALSLPKPDYPDKARNARVSGKVVVKVSIDEFGEVTSAQDMCGGPPYITEASLEAARRARFSPTKLSGQPVKVSGVIVYNFVAR